METELAAALAAQLPDVLVTASADLWPEVREFERALVTVMPRLDEHLKRGN